MKMCKLFERLSTNQNNRTVLRPLSSADAVNGEVFEINKHKKKFF